MADLHLVSRQETAAQDEGGPSNSRPSDKICADGSSPDHGFDTVRYRFRGCEPDAFARFLRSGEVGYRPGGERRKQVRGVTVGWWDDGRAYVEGRLAAILNGPDDHRLLGPDELVDGALVAQELAGADSAEAVNVGRADLTGELYFGNRQDGRRFLAGLAGVDVPWLKTGTEGGKRQGLETVYWRTATGRSVILRAYDKGVETGQAEPGAWVRFERQRRWRKAREFAVDEVAESDLRAAFVGRELAYMVEQAPTVHVVGGITDAIFELKAKAGRGELKLTTAARLIGYLSLGSGVFDARTAQRYELELRKAGVAVTHGQAREVVAVAPLLRELAERWAA